MRVREQVKGGGREDGPLTRERIRNRDGECAGTHANTLTTKYISFSLYFHIILICFSYEYDMYLTPKLCKPIDVRFCVDRG